MKKLFFYLAAASAILTGCTKTELDVETPVTPIDAHDASFVGTFAINEGTKTTIVPGDTEYNVYWEETDQIKVSCDGTNYYDFKIESITSGSAVAIFKPVDPSKVPADFYNKDSYTATFGDATQKSFTQDGDDNVKHLPMTATAGSDRQLNFTMAKPILAVKIPASVSAKSVAVVVRGGEEVSSVSSENALSAFYVPVPVSTAQYNIKAYSESSCENEIAESMKMQVSVSMTAGKIYPLTFTPTREITAAGTQELLSYPADYKVHILSEIADKVTITYVDGEAQHPANVYINANEKAVTSLDINTVDSHVEIEKGNSTNVTSKTSKNSFVVKPTYHISDKLNVTAGSVAAEGNVDGTKNVKEIVLDYPDLESMKGVIVYVSDVTAGAPVIITNNTESTEATPITVCGKEQKTSTSDGGYKITNDDVQNIQKLETVVAKIGDVVYPTLKAAYNNAQDGQTITLINDVDLKNEPLSEKYFKIEKSIDINLNGHTVTGKTETNPKGDSNDRVYVFVYDGYGPVHEQSKSRISGKVYNGTIICNHAGVYASEDADVVIENLTITQSRQVADYYFTHCALAASYGSTLAVKSGSYTGDAAVEIFNTGGIVTIEDGTFTGRTYAFDVNTPSNIYSESNSELYVKGGTILGSCNLPSGTPIGSFTRTISYTGGTFNVDPSDHVASGYEAVKVGDVWIVEQSVSKGVWTDYAATSFSSIDESNKTINITSAAELALVAKTLISGQAPTPGSNYYYAGWKIYLANDINLAGHDWVPIGNSTYPFFGAFDGNGNTVSNMTITTDYYKSGLFGVVHSTDGFDGAYFGNVIIDNANVKSKTSGAIVGVLLGGFNRPIDKVTVKNSTVESVKYAGAIAGENYYHITDCTVENTTVKGLRVGGIVGIFYGSSITNCVLKGTTTLTRTTADDSEMGGFIARTLEDGGSPTHTISGNTIYNTVKINGEYFSSSMAPEGSGSPYLGSCVGRDYNNTTTCENNNIGAQVN